jgi:hypothetical protein
MSSHRRHAMMSSHRRSFCPASRSLRARSARLGRVTVTLHDAHMASSGRVPCKCSGNLNPIRSMRAWLPPCLRPPGVRNAITKARGGEGRAIWGAWGVQGTGLLHLSAPRSPARGERSGRHSSMIVSSTTRARRGRAGAHHGGAGMQGPAVPLGGSF